ncbi:MAG TPA: bifunctional UDP-N-acetylglucosamine diphosphorylase/glucosamine-1-phosphate N-acetyltransferase GlmU [Burkholderiaceae bacterium]
MALSIVIMAAGKGTRMRSARPKVLHALGGTPLLGHVLATAESLAPDRCVLVTGHGAEAVEAAFAGERREFVRQMPQLGTGHAVQQAVPVLPDEGTVLVLNGDVPLIRPRTLQALVAASAGERLALLTVDLANPFGYGRIVRTPEPGDADGIGTVEAIVEEKDATPLQRQVTEVYTGIMAAPAARLKSWLARLTNDNAQGEYYLTDVVALAVADGVEVVTASAADETEVLGVNSPAQLADLERRLQRRRAEAQMEAGVRLADPARFDLRGTLACGQDVEIDVGCVFEGTVTLGDGVRVGAHCVIRDAEIAAGAVIHPFTHIEGARVGAGALIGPYARLRPGAALGEDVHIGNFVEVKNSTLARGAKANHLAYLGDATVGERVNFGAGAITANYDGANKHRTTIGADVHVGSNCVLVAPLTLGDGATIGGGSTITRDAPAHALTVARAKPLTIAGWSRPKKPGK